MAYDYLGTMDRDQFDDLMGFARKQKTLVFWQDDHAKAEIKRLDSLLAKLAKAHDVFFGGTLGAGQSIPKFRDREIFDKDDPSGQQGGASLDIEVPVNEPVLAHPGREGAFRLSSPSLKMPVLDTTPTLNDWDTAEVTRAIKAPFLPALKHQREQLEWRVRKVQDRQEQLEEARRRRAVAKATSIERFAADIGRMFGRAEETDDFYWWNLNPTPGRLDPTRPENIFKLDRYSQSQKEMAGAVEKAVESNEQLEIGIQQLKESLDSQTNIKANLSVDAKARLKGLLEQRAARRALDT